MMTRDEAKQDAETYLRGDAMTCTNRTGNTQPEEGYPVPGVRNGDAYADYTDNPHGPVIRSVGEPDSRWLCANGHGPFDEKVQDYIDDANVRRQIANIGKDNDPVNNPSHYGGADNPYEAIKVIEAWELGFNLGNTVKYISRAGKKNPDATIEDLKKAAWYLARHIDNLENDR